MTKQNLEAVWAKILRTLRENQNFGLFGLLSNMDDVSFVDDQIILHTHNEAEKNMIKNHLATLQDLAGAETKLVVQEQTALVQDDNAEYVTRLKDLFGDKVEIV